MTGVRYRENRWAGGRTHSIADLCQFHGGRGATRPTTKTNARARKWTCMQARCSDFRVRSTRLPERSGEMMETKRPRKRAFRFQGIFGNYRVNVASLKFRFPFLSLRAGNEKRSLRDGPGASGSRPFEERNDLDPSRVLVRILRRSTARHALPSRTNSPGGRMASASKSLSGDSALFTDAHRARHTMRSLVPLRRSLKFLDDQPLSFVGL